MEGRAPGSHRLFGDLLGADKLRALELVHDLVQGGALRKRRHEGIRAVGGELVERLTTIPDFGTAATTPLRFSSSTLRMAVTRVTPNRRMIFVKLGNEWRTAYFPARISALSLSAISAYPTPDLADLFMRLDYTKRTCLVTV